MTNRHYLKIVIAIFAQVFILALASICTYSQVSKPRLLSMHNQSFSSDTAWFVVHSGWNLLSLPVVVQDGRKSVLFPTARSEAFIYNGGYNKRDTLQAGIGYWLKFAQPETISIVGTHRFPETLAVNSRWNMIGSIDTKTPISRVTIIPSQNIISSYFAYVPGRGYIEVDTLESGKGYWVKAQGIGKLILPPPKLETPALMFPENGAVDQIASLTLKWQQVQYASWYRLQFATDSNFATTIIDDSTLVDHSYNMTNLTCSTKYYWRVRAKYDYDTSEWSDRWSFRIIPLLPVELISPAQDSYEPTNAHTLLWHELLCPALYRMQIGTDSSFSTGVVIDSLVSDTVYQFCSVSPNATYFWRVRGLSGSDTTSWTSMRKFRTIETTPLPNGLAIFGIVEGDTAGIWVFDPNTMKEIDRYATCIYPPCTTPPSSMVVSSDGSSWYYIWMDTLFEVDANTKAIVKKVKTDGYMVHMTGDSTYLITYGRKWTQFRNRQTFEVVRQDSLGYLLYMTSSPAENKFYAIQKAQNGTLQGVLVYDLDSFHVDRVIPIADSARQSIMEPADFDISPDGRYLYVSVFNWGSTWYNTYHVIDLATDLVIAEYSCGSYAQIGVSPDGHYVYLSDPRGYMYDFFPTWHVLRYDVQTRAMSVFIDWRVFNGLSYVSTSCEVFVSPNSKILFLNVGVGIDYIRTCDGKRANLLKIDVETKTILGVYEFEPDDRGYVHEGIQKLLLGQYHR
jgi:hypothetical protein